MPIFDAYKAPKDLLAKAVREGRRAYLKSESPQQVSDHFFNFCVTAHAIRDWCIQHLSFDEKSIEASNFHNRCCKSKNLKNCRDIANSSKHMVLRPGTVSTVASVCETQTATVAVDTSGQKISGSEMYLPSLEVQLPDGTFVSMFMLLVGAINDWQAIFNEYGIEFDARCSPILIVGEII